MLLEAKTVCESLARYFLSCAGALLICIFPSTDARIGCVRFWDPMKAAPDPTRVIRDTSDPQNGRIVAEVNSDIGHFSLGDRMEGEHRLVM